MSVNASTKIKGGESPMSGAGEGDPANALLGIDEAIGRMERFYRAVTGREAPPVEQVYAPIPVERDAGEYVEEQMNRLLGLLESPERVAGPAPAWAPAASVWETGSELLVRLDLPGVPRDQVEVTLHGSLVTISGTRAAPSGTEGALRLAESPSGTFRRALVLPGVRRGAEPNARMKDGVLEIRIARDMSHAEPPRTVPVS